MKSEFDHATDLAARSLKWTSLIEILSRTATPIVFVVLAAMLPPTDFGLLASAAVVVSFTQIFIDNGFGRALIQYNAGSLDSVASATFWFNLCLGVILYALIFAAAPLIATFFHENALIPIIRILGLQVVLASTSAVHQALLQRNFAFKKLLAVKLASAFIPGLISILLAWQGHGVWSLVIGTLAMAVINATALWMACSWRPTFEFDWSAIVPILGFGSWTLAEALASWAVIWADTIVGGYFLGVEQLGIYRIASNIVLVLFALTLNPLVALLYPYLARLQGDAAKLREVFEKLNRLVAAIALPVGLGLALVAPVIIPAIFGHRWAGLGLVVCVLSLREGIAWLASVNPELYRAVGRPDINVKIILLALCLHLPVFVLAAPYGLGVLAGAKVGLTVAALAIHLSFTMRILQIPRGYLWNITKLPLIACAAMCVAALSVQAALSMFTSANPIVSAMVVAVGGGAIYVLVLWRIDPGLISMISRLLNRAAS